MRHGEISAASAHPAVPRRVLKRRRVHTSAKLGGPRSGEDLELDIRPGLLTLPHPRGLLVAQSIDARPDLGRIRGQDVVSRFGTTWARSTDLSDRSR